VSVQSYVHFYKATRVAFNATIIQKKTFKSTMKKNVTFRPVPLETHHHRIGPIYCNIILFASKSRFWDDAIAMMAPESFYDPCNFVITRKNTINKCPSTRPQVAGQIIYMNVPPSFACQVITPSTNLNSYLIMVDNTSRNPQLVDSPIQ
jgi:hypothetical protein